MSTKTPLAKWLDNKYLEWQTQGGERKTILEFADYLGVNRSLLSYWMNGSREPSEDNLIKVSLKLGFEIFDILDKPRPNPLYLYVARNWEKTPLKVQRELTKLIAKYSSEPIPDETAENSTPKPK